jgi:hypothetical protein
MAVNAFATRRYLMYIVNESQSGMKEDVKRVFECCHCDGWMLSQPVAIPDEAGDCNDRRKEHLSHKDIEQ